MLVAPGPFKGTLSAFDAADALSAAVRTALPGAAIISCPVADGGEGTAATLTEHLSGELVPVKVDGLRGPIEAHYGWLPTDVAVVDLASVAGLSTVGQHLDVMNYTTGPLGDLMAQVMEREPRRLIVGIGDSATCDGGVGAAQRFGVGFFDRAGRPVRPGAAGLASIEKVDLTFRNARIFDTELILACDVNNALLGPSGAAHVYAPQKGATPDLVGMIEAGMERFSEVVMSQTGRWIGEVPFAGAGGGTAGGLYALLGGELRSGFDVFAEQVDFDRLLEGSELLIVGEGAIDEQSLSGKASLSAARRAKKLGIPVWAFGGRVDLHRSALIQAGVDVEVSLAALFGERGALGDPAKALQTVATQMLGRAFGG